MDWPSRELSQRLAEWQLCTPQDLARCRGAVKRFVRDLPSFDSIWIDALLQHGKLTPFQARVLDSPSPDRLKIAGCILTDCLEDNAWRSVYRARPVAGGDSCLLTIHPVHTEQRAGVLDELDATIRKLGGLNAGSLNIPNRAEALPQEVVVFSPDVNGSSLRELVVRRGRFPSTMIDALLRASIEALWTLETRGVAHGDLRARNISLADDGTVHLLHPGILPAVLPKFAVSQELSLDVYDHVAPEIIRGESGSTSASDQYALGCLLWQLAAGRPPFPTGDALSKVMLHQTKRIVDVREFAPHTPPQLAEVILRLTQPNPKQRYGSYAELRSIVGAAAVADRRQLKRFLSSFETDAPTETVREQPEMTRQLPTTLAAVVIGAATVWLLASDVSPARLAWKSAPNPASSKPAKLDADGSAKPIATATVHPGTAVVQTGATREAPARTPLPAPDATGTIQLKPGVDYTPRKVSFPSRLTIRGPENSVARIVVAEGRWELQADLVQFENVAIDIADSRSELSVVSRGLLMTRCDISQSERTPNTGCVWHPLDIAAASPGSIIFTDCRLTNTGWAVSSRPSLVRATHCLKTGPHPLFRFPAKGRAQQPLVVHAVNCTLRESGPLIAWEPGKVAEGKRIDVLTKACLFAPTKDTPLLALEASLEPDGWERTLTIGGPDSLIQAGSRIVDLVPPPGKPRGRFQPEKLKVEEGLQFATIEFFGSDVAAVENNGFKSTDASFSIDSPPGVKISNLPRSPR